MATTIARMTISFGLVAIPVAVTSATESRALGLHQVHARDGARVRQRRFCEAEGTERAASWLLGAGWTTWAMTTGPLSWTALGSLATLGVGIGASARATLLHEEARELEALAAAERQVARELSAKRRTIATEWVDRIQRVCGVSVRAKAVEMWPTGTGFTIDAELPAGGVTYDKIAQQSARLSGDAKLPHGCTATASPGIHQGRVLIDVTTVNVLVEERTYPPITAR